MGTDAKSAGTGTVRALVLSCCKCGSTEIGARYKPRPKTDAGSYGDDWIICKCLRCEYTWKQPPLDRQNAGGDAHGNR